MARTKAIAAAQAEPLPPGDSAEQRWAERLIVDAVASDIGIRAEPYVFILESGNRITVDGICRKPPVLIEAWAHIGPPKSAQRAKVLVDALKLQWLRSTVAPKSRCILALADEAAAAHFVSSRTWAGECLRDLGIEVRVAALPPDVRERLLLAQHRQFR